MTDHVPARRPPGAPPYVAPSCGSSPSREGPSGPSYMAGVQTACLWMDLRRSAQVGDACQCNNYLLQSY